MNEQELLIDEEFKSLLPSLDKETYALLEENIIKNGCRDAIVLWNGIIIDGHNRFAICTEHNIPFNTVNMEFGSREEVLIWIISTQVSRRNLTPIQMSHYRGLHYRADKKIQGTYDRKESQFEKRHNDVFQIPTNKRLGEKYRVSPKTIERDAKVAAAIDAIGAASPVAKGKILSGEVSIDKKVLEGLSSSPQEEIAELAASIEDGTYEKRKPGSLSQTEGGDTANPGSGSGGMRPFEAAIAKITDELLRELRKNAGSDDKTELKTSLRSYIDMLEDLYRQLESD